MIWNNKRYAKCMEALCLSWDADDGHEEGIGMVDARDEWHYYHASLCVPIADRIAEAIIERAAREWLENRGVYVCPSEDAKGLTGRYVAYHSVPGSSVPMGILSPVKGYAEAQAEAMLAMLGD
jgi:hypothetical protein